MERTVKPDQLELGTPGWVRKERARKALRNAKAAVVNNDVAPTPAVEVRLSVAIMHAPWVQERCDNVAVMLPQLPGAVLVEDTEREGIWATAKRAWLSYDKNATHHLLLQDDAILCKDFLAGVAVAVAARPASPISLFARHLGIAAARDRGEAWATMYHPTGLALILPTNLIADFIAWADGNFAASYKHDDERFHCWAIARGNPTRFTVPSLVEHRHFKSTAGNPDSERYACWFVGDGSALDIKW